MADQLPKAPDQFDRELDFPWIWKFLGVIAFVTVAMFVAMWFLSVALDERVGRSQPEASPLLQAGQTTVPPEPHLQVESYTDWAEMQAAQDRQNATYGWVDRDANRVRVPVAEAMDEIARRGLPVFEPTGDGTLQEETAQ